MSIYQFNLCREDLQLADKKLYERFRKLTPRKYVFWNITINIALWIPVGFGWAYTKNHYGGNAALALIGIVCCVLLSGMFGNYLSKKTLNYFRDQERKDIVKAKVELSESNIELETDGSKSFVKRSDISYIEVGSDICCIYIGNTFCFVIPRKGFEDQSQYDLFARELEKCA